MKKLICILITGISIATLCSCSHTISLGAIGHDYAKYNLDKKTETEEYKVVRTVSGEAKSIYFLGIGGFDNYKLNANSYANMVSNAKLKHNQAIINVISEMRIAIFPFVGVRAVHTTGTIIEFYNPTPTLSNDTTQKSIYPNFKYKVYDYYSDGIKNGVIISVSEDGKHGKILSLSQAYKTWDKALEWCHAQGKVWHIPTINEMNSILANIGIINAIMATKSLAISPDVQYWTSAELSTNKACVATLNGAMSENKNKVCCVLAVSDF